VSDRGAASDRDERDDAFALAGAGIVRVARHLSARGLSPGSSGNLSVRVGDRVLLTPTGSSLARVAADELAEVGLDGDPIGGERPTKELAIHLGVYAADPTARAVVHLHAPASTAISCLPPRADGLADLPTYTPYRVMSLGDVPLVPYAAPGDRALGMRWPPRSRADAGCCCSPTTAACSRRSDWIAPPTSPRNSRRARSSRSPSRAAAPWN
jgi:hypothetical protein